jgi:hypothetical protein
VPEPAPWSRTATSNGVAALRGAALEIGPSADVHLEVQNLSITYDPVHTTPDGRFYTIDGLAQSSPGRPIQPKTSLPLATVPGTEPHGILILAGQSTTDHTFDPVIARPVPTSTLQIQEPEFAAKTWFPSKMFAINRQGASVQEETAGHMVIIPAQYRGTQNIGQERRFTQLQIAVSYSDSPDRTPPVIWSVEVDPQDKRTLSVAAADASGIEQVWIIYSTDGDRWQNIELGYTAYTDRWAGTLPQGTEQVVFVVQAMDSAGNVAYSGNKGQFFKPTGDGAEIFLPLVLNKAQP